MKFQTLYEALINQPPEKATDVEPEVFSEKQLKLYKNDINVSVIKDDSKIRYRLVIKSLKDPNKVGYTIYTSKKDVDMAFEGLTEEDIDDVVDFLESASKMYYTAYKWGIIAREEKLKKKEIDSKLPPEVPSTDTVSASADILPDIPELPAKEAIHPEPAAASQGAAPPRGPLS